MIAACSQSPKTVSLRFKYRPGMRLTYDQVTKSSYKTTKEDSVVEKGSHTYTVDIVAKVLSLSADSIAEMIDSTSWHWTEPNKDDSTVLDTISRSRTARSLVQPDGRHVDIEIPDADEATVTWIKNYYEQGMPVFPEGELPVGYSWTQTTKVLLPDEAMDATTSYRIQSLAREGGYDCAVVEFEGNLIIPVEPRQEDTCKYSGWDDIQIEGVTYFAYKEGIILQERQTWKVTGTREGICESGKTMEFVVNTVSEIDYRLREMNRD